MKVKPERELLLEKIKGGQKYYGVNVKVLGKRQG